MKLIIINILLLGAFFIANKPNVAKSAGKHVIKLLASRGVGTGFYVVYKDNTYLLTNNHVCEASDDGFDTVDGHVNIVAKYAEQDLCLLDSFRRTGGLQLSGNTLEPLDRVSVVGHPFGGPLTARDGRLAVRLASGDRLLLGEPVGTLYLSIVIFPGSSGSPLVDEYGKLVGVVYAGNTASGHGAWAVPKDDIIKFLETQIK